MSRAQRSEFHIHCGPPTQRRVKTSTEERLDLRIGNNVRLKVEQVSKRLATRAPDRIIDLLEIATYVYAADQSVSRGSDRDIDFGKRWHRSIRMDVPVRDRSFWTKRNTLQQLQHVLSDLSDDKWRFEFREYRNPPPVQEHFVFGDEWPPNVDSVLLFSGGLDSLGGAIEEIQDGKRQIALVSHRSNPKTDAQFTGLFDELRKKAPGVRLTHVPVWASKARDLTKETTQRTRSFLYASLGMAVATMLRAKELKVYENGIISLNLPISDQLLGARATRSTHPCVMNGFEKLFGLLVGKSASVHNPFLWKTKTDIVRAIHDAGYGSLIRYTQSCGNTRGRTKMNTHCGECSQCIDRRFAILAAGVDEEDPNEMYGVDLLVGEREEGTKRTMMESYIRMAQRCAESEATPFFESFPAAATVVGCLEGSANDAADSIFNLYQKHAGFILTVLKDGLKSHADLLVRRKLPDSCALMLAQGIERKTRIGPDCCQVLKDPTGPENLTMDGRDRLVETSSDYDLFINGFSNRIETKAGGLRESLTPGEFEAIWTVAAAGQAVVIEDQPGSSARRKLFERGRKKINDSLSEESITLFTVIPGSARKTTAYEFKPPKDFTYCLIRPLSS